MQVKNKEAPVKSRRILPEVVGISRLEEILGCSVINEGNQVSYLLKWAVDALHRLATSCADLIEKQSLEPAAKYQLSRSVLKGDAIDSLAACWYWHSRRSAPGGWKNLTLLLTCALLAGHFLLAGVATGRLKRCSQEE